MTRPLNKRKKCNIKCERCQYYDKENYEKIPTRKFTKEEQIYYNGNECKLTGELKKYWNKCNKFKWHERYN